MKKTPLLLSLFVVVATLAAPVTASAQGLFGTVIAAPVIAPGDPSAAMLKIVPPRSGSVMLYQGQKIVGWWNQPGYASLRPGTVYGMAALRGNTLVFNSGLKLRPGHTTVQFDSGAGYPSIVYQPPFHYRPEAAHYHHRSDHRSPSHVRGGSSAATAAPRSQIESQSLESPKRPVGEAVKRVVKMRKPVTKASARKAATKKTVTPAKKTDPTKKTTVPAKSGGAREFKLSPTTTRVLR